MGEKQYMIVSVRSQKCLSVHKEKDKAGTEVVQEDICNEKKAQLWALHPQGGTLYIIESLIRKGLFLGIKGNSMDEGAVVVTTEQE